MMAERPPISAGVPDSGGTRGEAGHPFAVLDIGSNAIRMVVAQQDPDGVVRIIDSLEQSVTFGRQVFTKGSVTRKAIEDAVQVLRRFRDHLREYQILDPSRVRAVATSALREASNATDVVDRIEIATGFQVEVIDEAEVNRLTYLGVLPSIHAEHHLAGSPVVVLEVGGGSTEWLLLKDDDVMASHAFRLGSVRLRETLEGLSGPRARLRKLMEAQIEAGLEQGSRVLPPQQENLQLVGLGGDLRFAAAQLVPDWPEGRMARIPVSALSKLTDSVLGLSVDEIVRAHRLTYASAETLGPALLSYVLVARRLNLRHIWVTRSTLRDGLMNETASPKAWAARNRGQILRSAIALGQRYGFEEDHGVQVAANATALFEALRDDHGLDERHELLLHVAGILHEIGLFISNRSHHKHSQYIIQNSDVFGLGRRDLLLVGLVARYHRRAAPKPDHEGYNLLDRASRLSVVKMAAILRVADALERTHVGRIRNFTVRREADRFVVEVAGVDDVALEQLALEQKGGLFEEVFGRPVVIESAGGMAP